MKREKENGEGEKKEAGGDGVGTEGMRGWPSGDAGQDVAGVGVDDVGGRCDVGDQVGSDEAEDQGGGEGEGFKVTTSKSEDEQENENAEEKEEETYDDGSDSEDRLQNENEVGKESDIGEGHGDGDKELEGGLAGGDEDTDMDNVIVTEEESDVSQSSKEGEAKKGVKEDAYDGKRKKNTQGKDDVIISKDKAITISTTSIVEKTDEGSDGESEEEIHDSAVDPHKEVWPKKKKKNREVEEEEEEVEESVDIVPDEEGTWSGPEHSFDEENIEEKEEEEEEEEMVEVPEEGGRIVGGVFIEQTITVQGNGDVVDEVLEGHGVGQGQHVGDGKVEEGESVKDVQRSEEEEEEVAKRNISSGNSIGGRRADGVWQRHPAQDDQEEEEEEEEEKLLLDKISFVLFSPSSSPITIAVLSTLLVSSIIGLACIYCRGRRR